MLNTWSITEIPPKPSKNAQRIILIEIAFSGIFATIFTPLVNSIIPLINPEENSGFIFNTLNTGIIIADKIFRIPLLFIIEIITLNKTTKPPISITVCVAFVILRPRILPKLFMFADVFSLKYETLFIYYSSSCLYYCWDNF